MPKINKITSAFNVGEIDPKLAVRTDIDQFRRGAKKARNVELNPQGGFGRRGGFQREGENIYYLEYTKVDVELRDQNKMFLLETFEITKDLTFQILFHKSNDEANVIHLAIFENGEFLSRFEYATVTNFNDFNCKDINVCQNVNNFIVVHPDIPVKNLQLEDEGTRTFTLTDVEFKKTPQFVFFDELSPKAKEERQAMHFWLDNVIGKTDGDVTDNSTASKENRSFRFSFNGEISDEIIYYSPFKWIDGVAHHYETKADWYYLADILFDGITDDTRELNILFSENNTGFTVDCGSFKRSDYGSDLLFVEAIESKANSEFYEMLYGGGLFPPIREQFQLSITSGSYATGNLKLSLQCNNLNDVSGDIYLTAGRFIIIGEEDIKSTVVNNLVNNDINSYLNGLTFFQIYEQFKKFTTINKFSDIVWIQSTLATLAQRTADDLADNTKRSSASSIYIYFRDEAAGNYPIISGEYTEPFVWDFENSTIKGVKVQVGSNGEENVWSEIRGYPRSCAFVENRLVFGGSRSLNNVIWASNTGDFFNFQNTQGNASEAILNLTATTKTLSGIQYLIGEKSLQVFTEGSEHYNPNALTTDEVSLPLQSSEGIPRIKPIIIDNATYFVDKNKRTLRRFLYDDLERSYKAENVSILSSHLIKTPVDIAAVNIKDSNFITLVNLDGTMTVFQTIRDQNISGYALWDSEAFDFVAATESGDNLYSLVKTDHGTNVRFRMTKYDDSKALDFEENGIIDSAIIPKTENTYSCIYNDYDEGQKSIELNKKTLQDALDLVIAIDPNDNLNNEYQFGFDFRVYVETTDISIDFGVGEYMSKKKKISESWLHLDNTAGWHLNYKNKEYIISYRNEPLSDTPILFTGDKRVKMMGYIERDSITIEQVYPYSDGSVLGITISIKV